MRKLAITLVLTLSISGCSQKPESIDSLVALRDAFVEAGGQCWEWKVNNPSVQGNSRNKAIAECDRGTMLILIREGANPLDQALVIADLLRSVNLEINLLVGDNWIINSDQVESVQGKLGGTLITR